MISSNDGSIIFAKGGGNAVKKKLTMIRFNADKLQENLQSSLMIILYCDGVMFVTLRKERIKAVMDPKPT